MIEADLLGSDWIQDKYWRNLAGFSDGLSFRHKKKTKTPKSKNKTSKQKNLQSFWPKQIIIIDGPVTKMRNVTF